MVYEKDRTTVDVDFKHILNFDQELADRIQVGCLRAPSLSRSRASVSIHVHNVHAHSVHARSCVHAHSVHAHSHARLRVCAHRCVRMCIVHTQTHTHTHTHTNTHDRMQAHTLTRMRLRAQDVETHSSPRNVPMTPHTRLNVHTHHILPHPHTHARARAHTHTHTHTRPCADRVLQVRKGFERGAKLLCQVRRDAPHRGQG